MLLHDDIMIAQKHAFMSNYHSNTDMFHSIDCN